MNIDNITSLYRTYMQIHKYRNIKLHSETELAEKISELKSGEMLNVAIIDDGDADAN